MSALEGNEKQLYYRTTTGVKNLFAEWHDGKLIVHSRSFFPWRLTPEEAIEFTEWVIRTRPEPVGYRINTVFSSKPTRVEYEDISNYFEIEDGDLEEIWE